MPVGFRNAAGVDLESLFDPDVVGDGPTAPFLRTAAGTPLRFAAIAYGSKGPDVGYRTSAGVDVSNLWAAAGTAQYGIPGLQGKGLNATGTAATNQQTAFATVSVNIAQNGTWTVSGGNQNGPVPQAAPTTGTWLPSGRSAADYDILIRTTSQGDAQAANNATVWRALGTGAGASIAVSVPGASQQQLNASMTVAIDLRYRPTGAVSTTTLGGSVTAIGFA